MQDLKKLSVAALKQELSEEGQTQTIRAGCSIQEQENNKQMTLEKRTFVLGDYIPDPDQPLTFICVNLHVFQDASGGRNYNKNHIKDFKAIFNWINGYHTNYHEPNYLGQCTSGAVIPRQIDSRIRFVLNRIEFYQDDSLWGIGGYNFSALKNAMLERDPDMDDQLNIFLTAPAESQHSGGYTQLPSTNLNFKQYIHVVAGILRDHPPFSYSQLWAHELGHVLGLRHTYLGGGASPICNEDDPFFLYDIFGCGADKQCPIPENLPNNNLMGGKESWSISTLQIAKMHYSLQHLSVQRYAKGMCCTKCVAFGAKIFRHLSQGPSQILKYETVLANEPWAWDGRLFTCPVDGIYHFSIAFQKDSLVDGGTPNDVWVKLWANWDLIGTAWSEKADLRTGWSPEVQQFGRRDSVSFSMNVELKKGTIVKTEVGSQDNEKRHLVDVNFCGHLICSNAC